MGSYGQQETVRMLVLETDEPHPEITEEKGSYGEILKRLFRDAGENHEPPLSIQTEMHFVVDDPENGHHGHVPSVAEIPQDFSAILITGSMYDAHGDDPWILALKHTIYGLWKTRPEMKFAGICFGHQVLASALGAINEPTPGEAWELAHTSLELSEIGKKLFKTTENSINVHQMHQDQVKTVPSSQGTDLLRADQKVHVWASTEHTPIQVLYIRDRLFSSQGHLGFDEKMVKKEVEARIRSGAIKPDQHGKEVKYAEETAHFEHDGEVIAAAILRFFHGDDHDID